jgi:hypothetical protein
MGLGPELFVAVFVEVGDLLDGRPAKYGIVANKRCDVAVGDSVADGRVDEVGEESDTESR